jgi:hypothetical protein
MQQIFRCYLQERFEPAAEVLPPQPQARLGFSPQF